MLIKTYQRAITGGRRAGKKLVKMILERQKLRFKSRAPRSPRITSQIEKDPENALEALEILGIASRRANTNAGDTGAKEHPGRATPSIFLRSIQENYN
jgi:hypothetical protein